MSFLQGHIPPHRFITYRANFKYEISFGKVLQEIMSGYVGYSTDCCSFQSNSNIGQMFFCIFIKDMTNNIRIRFTQFRILRMLVKSSLSFKSRQQCTAQADKRKYVFFHFSFIIRSSLSIHMKYLIISYLKQSRISSIK